jgi:F0F1-type ATP synthase assembly protein I
VSTELQNEEKDASWQASIRESSPYMGLGFQLAGAMLIYIFGGYLLDLWLDTSPWFLLAGSVVGMIAFFFQIYRLTIRLSKPKSEKPTSDRENPE